MGTMKKLPLVILLVGILCAALTESKPAAWKRRYYSNRNYGRNYGRSYSRGGGGPNQLLKQVGTAKILAGAGLAGLGIATNNNGLTNAGLNIGALGVGSKLLAHVIGKK